jgi:hypothetical protein
MTGLITKKHRFISRITILYHFKEELDFIYIYILIIIIRVFKINFPTEVVIMGDVEINYFY